MESYEQLSNFVTQIENAGCENFVIHARKASVASSTLTMPPLIAIVRCGKFFLILYTQS
jgi:tRNA-dihydrouridine synthase